MTGINILISFYFDFWQHNKQLLNLPCDLTLISRLQLQWPYLIISYVLINNVSVLGLGEVVRILFRNL